MKKIFSIIVFLLIFANTQLFAQTGISGALSWSIANDTLTIRVTAETGTAPMNDFGTSGGITTAPWGSLTNRNLFSTVIIEYGVTSIGHSAFHSLSITSVTIPNSVTSIGTSAFRGTSLTSVTIPNSITSIGQNVFSDLNLRSVIVEGGSGTLTIGSGNAGIFNNTSIDSVYIGRNIVRASGSFPLFGTEMRHLTIGNNATSIVANAFQNNTSLTSVIIGYNVATIGATAFNGCTSLAIVTSLRPTPPTVSANTFTGVSGACLLVPVGSTNAYQTAFGWGVFSSCIQELDGDVPHTVIFNSMGGSSVATRFVTDGEKVPEPTPPNRIEHGFAGWYKEIEHINRWDFNTDVVTSDITLFAKWISFTSLFDSIAILRDATLALQADTLRLYNQIVALIGDTIKLNDSIRNLNDTITSLRILLEICVSEGGDPSANTEILEITVEGISTIRNGTNFSITADCDQETATIVIVPDDPRATVEINDIVQNSIVLDLELHGDNVFNIKITAPNGDYTNYKLTINRPIPFEQITVIRWGMAVSVINNPENNNGHTFNSFQWFHNDELFSERQWWSINEIQNFNPADNFRVEVITTTTNRIQSCESSVELFTAQTNVFPNPVAVGQTFYVETDFDERLLQNVVVKVYNSMGIRHAQLPLQGQRTPINLNLLPGVHIVVLADNQGFRKEIKTVVR